VHKAQGLTCEVVGMDLGCEESAYCGGLSCTAFESVLAWQGLTAHFARLACFVYVVSFETLGKLSLVIHGSSFIGVVSCGY
jgi:hypothetical protein